MRSGVVGSSDETYTKNYIFDDISQNFSGTRDTYTLTSDGSNVIGVSTFNSILLVNGIVQGPGATNDYTLSETSGITSVTFTGSISTTAVYNPNDLNVPIGGVIISVAGTNGFGYQPLVSAGGTSMLFLQQELFPLSLSEIVVLVIEAEFKRPLMLALQFLPQELQTLHLLEPLPLIMETSLALQ